MDEVTHVKQESTFKSHGPAALPKHESDSSGKDVFVQSEEDSAAPKCYSGTFLLKYLCYFTRHLSLSDTTRVFIRNDYPRK